MSQDIRLYGREQVWDQPLQDGQRNLLQAILDFWPVGIESALDVGCGDGKLTRHLQEQRSVTLVGLDSSTQALSHVPFASVLGDAQALPFASASFDLVMSTDALEHMPMAQEANAWQELFRVAEKVVMVAVPFREELLDATACCAACSHRYHVNWHERSYDIADLHQRCPSGWSVGATVLTGEPWSPMLSPETHLRRQVFNEWAGWDLALCPACGASGQAAPVLQPLPSLFAQVLAEQFYPALAKQHYCRSHSEILVIFERDSASLSKPAPCLIEPREQTASRLDFAEQQAIADLRPFCQVAQHVARNDGQWRIQFPLYHPHPILEVSRKPGSQGALHLVLEDEAGCLLAGCVLEEGEQSRTHRLPRPPVAGYYGILASCPMHEPFASLQLGEAPSVLWCEIIDDQPYGYLRLTSETGPVFVQAAQSLWFDPQTLIQNPSTVEPSPDAVLAGLQARFESMTTALATLPGNDEHEAELNRLHIQIQNLTADNHALLQRAAEADRLAVKTQNLAVERDALHERAKQADLLLVKLQNLTVERDALHERAAQVHPLLVKVQNLTVERDALHERAVQIDPLLVNLQNLTVERDALHERAAQVDPLLVSVQNLTAERDALNDRATQVDDLLVSVENLKAERDALHRRAVQADRLLVNVQNLAAERDALSGLIEAQTLESRHHYDALHQQLSTLQAALQAAQSEVVEALEEKQQLHSELLVHQARLETLNNHMENQVGTAIRAAMAHLNIGKK